jgi:hypothetical protein
MFQVSVPCSHEFSAVPYLKLGVFCPHPHTLFFVTYVLVLSFHSRLKLYNCIFSSVFPTTFLYAFHLCPMCPTHLPNLIIEFAVVIVVVEKRNYVIRHCVIFSNNLSLPNSLAELFFSAPLLLSSLFNYHNLSSKLLRFME